VASSRRENLWRVSEAPPRPAYCSVSLLPSTTAELRSNRRPSSAGIDGQFAQGSSGKSLFSFWLRRPIYRRGLSPLTRKETRPCHGQLRHLSKCASALRSTAICRPSFEQCPPAAACGRHTIAIVLGSALTACPYGNRGRMSRHGAGTNSTATT
jgi:hypothetical protein